MIRYYCTVGNSKAVSVSQNDVIPASSSMDKHASVWKFACGVATLVRLLIMNFNNELGITIFPVGLFL